MWDKYGSQLSGFNMGRTILCEKTDIKHSPYVCDDGEQDCYRLTLISRFMKNNSKGQQIAVRQTSADVIVKVANPKTKNAYISNVVKVAGSEKIGPVFPYSKFAEPVIVGDNRLLIVRLNNADLTVPYKDGSSKVRKNINIAYSVYPRTNKDGTLSGVPLAFQNAAISDDDFMAVPYYGRAIGQVRMEPIAKGGIHGKGAWLKQNFGIQFEVPR